MLFFDQVHDINLKIAMFMALYHYNFFKIADMHPLFNNIHCENPERGLVDPHTPPKVHLEQQNHQFVQI